MTKTYCQNLWRSLAIFNNGEVYPCCHKKPRVLGNLKYETLEEIWNNKFIKACRKDSIDGDLECFKNCLLLKNSPYVPKIKSNGNILVDYKDLQHVIIFFGKQCNLKCLMCRGRNLMQESLKFDTLISKVNFNHIKYVDILGGEPLIMKEALKLFDYLIDKKIMANFISNGTVMTGALAKKIADHSYSFTVSLNAATKKTHEKINIGSKWEKVLENIKKVNFYKNKDKTNLISHGHMTIVMQNFHEIPLFIKNYKKLGFDRIDFGFDEDSMPIFLKKHPSIRKRLSHLIKKSLIGKNLNDIMTHRLNVLNLI